MTTITTRAGKGNSLTWAEMDANFTNLNTNKAESASPALTGTPVAPTAAVDTNTTQIATTAFVVGQGYAKIASPTFTGTVTLPASTTLTTPTMITPTVTGNATVNGTVVMESPFEDRNRIINGGFTINQRKYTSSAVLASGSFGHDRWKAGASGGDYSFTQLGSATTITIASGKSLIQVVEGKNVNSSTMTLSWSGTAQARYSVNGTTPSGSYAASPVTITGLTPGTVMSVEFNTGTLGQVMLEAGSVATPYPHRQYSFELILCKRYYFKLIGNNTIMGIGRAIGGNSTKIHTVFDVEMASAPIALETDGTTSHYTIEYAATSVTCSSIISFSKADTHSAETIAPVSSGLTLGHCVAMIGNTAAAYLAWSAEL